MRRWIYRPARVEGQPVAVWKVFRVKFTLRPEREPPPDRVLAPIISAFPCHCWSSSTRPRVRPDGTCSRASDVSIGRSSENEIVLNDFSVSRKHAAHAERERDVWTIEDQNSTNGIKVNGRFVPRPTLAAGDVLTVGTFTLTVRGAADDPRREQAVSISDSTSTFVRSIADFNRDFGLDAPRPRGRAA